MSSAVDTLEARLGANWPAIRTARHKTEEIVARLGGALSDLDDASFSIVVTAPLDEVKRPREATPTGCCSSTAPPIRSTQS